MLFASSHCDAIDPTKMIVGTWMVTGSKVKDYVSQAIKLGFLNIDTAQAYNNESDIGEAIRSCARPQDVYVTTKFNISKNDMLSGNVYDCIKNKLDASIAALGHVDEFLLHDLTCCEGFVDDISLILSAFSELEHDDTYSHIKFGLSNVSSIDLGLPNPNPVFIKQFLSSVKVVQNPYWYGCLWLSASSCVLPTEQYKIRNL